MPENVKGFFLYHDQAEPLRALSREQKGELLEMLFDYSMGEAPTSKDGFVMMAFNFISAAIKRDREQYAEKCEKLRSASQKAVAKRNQKAPIGGNNNQMASIGDNGKENDQMVPNGSKWHLKQEQEQEQENNINPHSPLSGGDHSPDDVTESQNDATPQQEAEDDDNAPVKETKFTQEFLTFWAAYPKKVGKDAAFRAWRKKKREKRLPPLAALLDAIEQAKRSDQWRENAGQYIPNPSTWLNQGRWEDDFSELKNLNGNSGASRMDDKFTGGAW